MTTYVYQTIPSKPDEKTEYFEIKQNMNDAPLTTHPETGKPIRRVILGGFGVLSSRGNQNAAGSGVGCCGGSNCGC